MHHPQLFTLKHTSELCKAHFHQRLLRKRPFPFQPISQTPSCATCQQHRPGSTPHPKQRTQSRGTAVAYTDPAEQPPVACGCTKHRWVQQDPAHLLHPVGRTVTSLPALLHGSQLWDQEEGQSSSFLSGRHAPMPGRWHCSQEDGSSELSSPQHLALLQYQGQRRAVDLICRRLQIPQREVNCDIQRGKNTGPTLPSPATKRHGLVVATHGREEGKVNTNSQPTPLQWVVAQPLVILRTRTLLLVGSLIVRAAMQGCLPQWDGIKEGARGWNFALCTLSQQQRTNRPSRSPTTGRTCLSCAQPYKMPIALQRDEDVPYSRIGMEL